MQLSQETLLGLRMTGLSIIVKLKVYFAISHCSALSLIELVSFVFTIPGVKSENLPRPLGNFFGCQRQKGGTHDNPTVAKFEKNMQALRVINSDSGTNVQ